MSKVVWLMLCLILCFYTVVSNYLKNGLTPQKIAQNILKLAEEVSDTGKRDVLVLKLLIVVIILVLKYKR